MNEVHELAAHGADEALADRVHPRRLHRGAHDRGAGGLEDGTEGRGEVRAAVTDEEPEVPEPVTHSSRPDPSTREPLPLRSLADVADEVTTDLAAQVEGSRLIIAALVHRLGGDVTGVPVGFTTETTDESVRLRTAYG